MKPIFTTLLLFLCVNVFAQEQIAVHLGSNSKVTNSIIFRNSTATPVSSGVSVTFSASDSILPAGNNVHLPTTPFSSGFRINTGSSVYMRGNRLLLNAWDTLDLGYNPRVSCDELDIGAYEAEVVKTRITSQPILAERVCEGGSVLLQVEAEGSNLTYQWQKNGVNLTGRTSSTLSISNVAMADTGNYRVIVFGACCNDTSNVVRLDVDLKPILVVMNDTTIVSGEDVTLRVIESVGNVVWYESDMVTVVSNTTITNITESMQFFAVATNGVCTESATASVSIFISGLPCRVRTPADATVCREADYRLLFAEATVSAHWVVAGTTTEISNGTIVRPTETTTYVLIGLDADNEICDTDTLVLTVNPPDLRSLLGDSIQVCEGEQVHLQTNINPALIVWERLSDGQMLDEDPTITALTKDVFRAHVNDASCGDIYIDVIVDVQPRPTFNIIPHGTGTVPQGTSISLTAIPNATQWTLLDGTRVFMPVTLESTETFIGIYVLENCRVEDTITINVESTQIDDTLRIEIEFVNGCFLGDGSAMVEVLSGTPPFTYAWSNGATTALIENLIPGTYTVTVTDDLGETKTASVTIEMPQSEIQVTHQTKIATNEDCNNGSITITVTGGTPPYDFEWKRNNIFVSAGQNLTNEPAGTYNLLVIDSEGCEKQMEEILLRCEFERVMPSILLSPNNDGLNDFVFIQNIDFYPTNTVTIINSYGAEIMKIQNYDNKERVWTGFNRNGQLVPDGTYYYVVSAEGIPPMAGWIIVRLSANRR